MPSKQLLSFDWIRAISAGETELPTGRRKTSWHAASDFRRVGNFTVGGVELLRAAATARPPASWTRCSSVTDLARQRRGLSRSSCLVRRQPATVLLTRHRPSRSPRRARRPRRSRAPSSERVDRAAARWDVSPSQCAAAGTAGSRSRRRGRLRTVERRTGQLAAPHSPQVVSSTRTSEPQLTHVICSSFQQAAVRRHTIPIGIANDRPSAPRPMTFAAVTPITCARAVEQRTAAASGAHRRGELQEVTAHRGHDPDARRPSEPVGRSDRHDRLPDVGCRRVWDGAPAARWTHEGPRGRPRAARSSPSR